MNIEFPVNETIPDAEKDLDGWVKWKKRRIGGHAAAAIIGVHPRLTIMDVYDLIVHGIENRAMSEETENFLEWCSWQEPLLVRRYVQETGYKVRRVRSLVHPTIPLCVCSPDREIIGQERGVGLLEVKSVRDNLWRKMEMDGLDKFPWVQNQFYLWGSGRTWGDICAGSRDNGKILTFGHEADTEFQQILEKKILAFVKMVEDETPPIVAPDPVRLPETGGSMVRVETMDEQAITLFSKLTESVIACGEMMKEAKEIDDEARARLKKFMETTGLDCAQLGSVRAYYKEQAGRKTFDKVAFKRAHPKIDLSEFDKQGEPFRTLRVYPNVKSED